MIEALSKYITPVFIIFSHCVTGEEFEFLRPGFCYSSSD